MADAADDIRLSTVALAGGPTLQYAEHGDAGGEPVVLLHGYTDSWYSFSRVLPLLPPTLRAFALSQRGHGDSDRPDGPYAVDDMAGDVVAFLDAVGVERAALVGHSGGSFTARRAARLAPDRVTRLALLSSAPSALNAATTELRAAVHTLADPVPDEFAREFQTSTLYGPVPDDFFERAVGESLKLPAHVWIAALDGVLDLDDSAELAGLRCPTLLLWGEKDDMFTREDQETLAASIPGSRLVAYPDTGHALHWERPEAVAEDLAEFLLPS